MAHRRIPALIGVAALVAFGVVAGPLGEAAAGAAVPATTAASTLSLVAASTVKTSNGQSWDLAVSWVEVSASFPASVYVQIERTVTSPDAGYEAHSWSIPVKTNSLTFSSSTGKGSLNPGSETSPLASIDLAFDASSHQAVSCSSGSATRYTGTLTGKLTLVTGLSGGGTIGSSAMKFVANSPEVEVDSGCVPKPTAQPCAAGTDFDAIGASSAPGVVAISSGTGSTEQIAVVRQTDLSAPSGAVRSDQAGLTKAPAPTYSASTKKVSVTTSSSGIVTGSATLSGGKQSTSKSTCKSGGVTYTLTDLSDPSATYASPSGKALAAHTSLTGVFSAPAKIADAEYDVTTRTKT